MAALRRCFRWVIPLAIICVVCCNWKLLHQVGEFGDEVPFMDNGIAKNPRIVKNAITPESVKSSWNVTLTKPQTVQHKTKSLLTAENKQGSNSNNGQSRLSVPKPKLQNKIGSNGETIFMVGGKKYTTLKKGSRGMTVPAATSRTAPTDILKPKTATADATTKSLHSPPPPTDRTCLTEECIQEQATHIALAFSDRHDQDWIVTAPSPTPSNYTHEGILLVKNYKAASSTTAGAVLRIATKHGINGLKAWNRWHHTPGVEYTRRHPQRSFLLSSVRDPAARGISRIFYTYITQLKAPPNDNLIMKFLKSNHTQFGASSDQGGFQLSYLSLRGTPLLPYISWDKKQKDHVLHRDLVEQQVQYILQDYDFLLVAERMDESLVALSMIMGVEVGEVLTNDAKIAGSDYSYVVDDKGEHCQRIKRSFRSNRVKQFLESDEWRARSYGDYLLHAAAIQSLELTIERLGPFGFETRLVEYRRLKDKARTVCANAIFLQCSATGKPQRLKAKQNCYADDGGCGYRCMDDMLANETRFGIIADDELVFGKETSSLQKSTVMSPPPSNRTCLTEVCFQETAALIARSFPNRHDKEWIINNNAPSSPTSHNNYTAEGILLVKNYKAASSTAAGVVLRIATQHGEHGGRAWNRWHHTKGVEYAQRHPQRSFLLTTVRDPAARGLSRVFYSFMTKLKISSTDTNVMKWLQYDQVSSGTVNNQGGHQLVYLTVREKTLPYTSWDEKYKDHVLHQDLVERHVQYILQDYDFILVAERMDESLVALSMVMGIEVGDVLVNDAKVAAGSGYAYFNDANGERCMTMERSFRSNRVKQFLESDEWKARSYGDYLLHTAAIQSLELTIERLGRAPFETHLAEYRRLKKKSLEVCANATSLHCSAEGKPQTHLSKENCYGDDSGCGYPCIDEMFVDETKHGAG